MSENRIQLLLITPEKQLFSGDVISVVFPGESGKFGVKSNHAPIVSALSSGEIEYTTPEKESKQVQIKRGVVEVVNNRITACIEQ